MARAPDDEFIAMEAAIWGFGWGTFAAFLGFVITAAVVYNRRPPRPPPPPRLPEARVITDRRS
jgi:hypothetical protein